jgi:hypothetical protein
MYTDFAAQQPKSRVNWGHETYRQFRDEFFFDGWLGQGQSCIVEHITELSQNDKGETGAMLHLIADLYGGGTTGDNTLRGRERKLESAWQMVTYDQMRNGVVTKGELAEQKSVIKTRDEAKDVLGRWLANTTEDQIILAASGISFAYEIDGSPRVAPAGQDNWTALDYAANVRAPSANRHLRWDSTTGSFVAGDTTAVIAADTPVYKMLPQLWALARRRRIKPIRVGKKDYLVLLTPPETISAFYQDPDFRQVIVQGGVRGTDNPIFANATVTMHGFVLQEYNKVFTTLGAASGSKWGAAGTVDGARSLLLGSQALAFADLKVPAWKEEMDDYENVKGIACRKWMGVLQPRYPDPFTGTVEDFNRICIDHAI